MKKKVLSVILSVAMVATLLVGCGAKEEAAAPAAQETAKEEAAEEAAPAAEANGKKVGVAMPTQSSERWINDGNNMKKQLDKP